MDPYEEYPMQQQDLKCFSILFGLSQLMGAGTIICLLMWVGSALGGVSGPSDVAIWFNWHPILMTLGLIIIQGDSILIYRVLRNDTKPRLKATHAILHFTAFILVVIGLKAAFDSHNYAKPPIRNLYTLHSWIGLTTVILFALQFVIGFLSFMFPGIRRSLRTRFLPLHVFMGTVIFILSITTAHMGITEKLTFIQMKGQEEHTGRTHANFLGVFITLFGILVLYLVGKQSYKRIPPPEEQVLPLENSESDPHLRAD